MLSPRTPLNYFFSYPLRKCVLNTISAHVCLAQLEVEWKLTSVPRSVDQKVATLFAKSSHKVANFFRQSLLSKMRFLCKIDTFWRDFFLSDKEIFPKFSKNANFFKKFLHKSLKSPVFWLILHNF